MFIDLEATREDHEEVRNLTFHDPFHTCVNFTIILQTGNEKEVTMQAGKQRGALPLIRKFNEHSERLLKSALCVSHTLSSHLGSDDISIDPWTALTNGEESIQAMLMMCVVSSTQTPTSSHSE
jgi:transcription initiation factor TFIIH subunit 1